MSNKLSLLFIEAIVFIKLSYYTEYWKTFPGSQNEIEDMLFAFREALVFVANFMKVYVSK